MNDSNNNETIVLGPEYDLDLRKRLLKAIKTLDGKISNKEWGIGGSQEILEFDVTISDRIVKVESETYIGLSITGSPDLIKKIDNLIKIKS